MKFYDLTGTKIIEAMDTPCIHANDNLTLDEKVEAFDDWQEWFLEVMSLVKPNVVYLKDYLK